MPLLSMISSYLRGNEQILVEVVRESAERQLYETPDSYGGVLARVIPPGEIPALEEIVEEGVLRDFVDVESEAEHEKELVFGVNLILDGIESLVEQNCGRSPGR